ncbi:family 2 glycosyl transferase [Flammeovirgaceae bacterium 311]|nr:family 2 glycosyl transferase [Flammeovirgaceae bacterium 311]
MKELFKKHNCCVIIPTYNNGGTLQQVIEDVLHYTEDLIVVNDGATDSTDAILEQFADKVHIIRHEQNSGKGMALRNGFTHALAMGYDYAITIDSDAQHFASDLPLFLAELEQNPEVLVIGARNMKGENVPGKSSFGNKFSNFWFWVETGHKMDDTQSGYRLYPIRRMEGIRFKTRLFEFEIEAIVKSAWRGIPVKNIPIQVHYEPGKKRITHFRPLRDFSRISVLNTYLVTLALLYYIPLRFFKLLTRENIRNFIQKNFFDKNEPLHIKAFSIAFGVFMGIFPVWGFQLLIGIPLAHLMKLNKALFITAAHVSIPPTVPFIIYGSYLLGGVFMKNPQNDILFNEGLTLETIKGNLFQYLSGAVMLSIGMAVLCGLISYLYFYIARSRRLAVKPLKSSV